MCFDASDTATLAAQSSTLLLRFVVDDVNDVPPTLDLNAADASSTSGFLRYIEESGPVAVLGSDQRVEIRDADIGFQYLERGTSSLSSTSPVTC